MQMWPNSLWLLLATRHVATLVYNMVIPISLVCKAEDPSQILYASRMGQACKVPQAGVSMNHDLVREGVFNLKDLDELTGRAVRMRV